MSLTEQGLELIIQYGLKLIGAVIVFFIGKLLIKITMKYIKKWVEKKLDSTLHSFVETITKTVLYILLLITTASTLGVQMSSFIAILGAGGLAVGLSLQGSLANFAGGVLILTFRPFGVGDFIETDGSKGRVQSIQILYTRIITLDNKQIVIPNGTVSNSCECQVILEKKCAIIFPNV